MKTEFLPPSAKGELIQKIASGDKKSINVLINELDRLENLVRTFESVVYVCQSQTFKAIDTDQNKTPEL